jgi:hypothetical protein
VKTIHDPDVRKTLEGAGLRLATDDRSTPVYLDELVKREITKWSEVIRKTSIEIQ